MMNMSSEKILEAIKRHPVFSEIVKQSQEETQMREQRWADIAARAELLDARPAELRQEAKETEASYARIVKARKELQDAVQAGSDIERKHATSLFLFNQKLGELESRLRLSAPQKFYDRVEEIKAELEQLYKAARSFSPNTPGKKDWRALTCAELPGTIARVEELRHEMDDIMRRKIYEEYGLNDEEEKGNES